MQCPRCKGHGEFSVPCDVFKAKMWTWRKVWCSQCQGTGHISRYQMTWIRNGFRLNALRASLGLCMSEAANLAHVNIVLWNDAEHGRTDPRPMMSLMRSEGATI
jgi:hypothetical protein